jgi:hypothetical protein
MARLPSPLQQGDLDGLCGAYAVVNAVTRLLHDRGFTREDANRLFKRLCHALHRRQKMPQAVWRGTHIEDVDAMLQTVQRFVRESFDLRLVVSRPFAAENVKRKDRFFNVLSAAFNADDRRKVAILGLDKPGFHWTNVTDVTRRSFRLYDSGRCKRLRYCDCTVGETVRKRQVLLPHETRILSLEERPIVLRRTVVPPTRRVAARPLYRIAA